MPPQGDAVQLQLSQLMQSMQQMQSQMQSLQGQSRIRPLPEPVPFEAPLPQIQPAGHAQLPQGQVQHQVSVPRSYDYRRELAPWPSQLFLGNAQFTRSYRVNDNVTLYFNNRTRSSVLCVQGNLDHVIPVRSVIIFGRRVGNNSISIRHMSDRNRVSRAIISAVMDNVLFCLKTLPISTERFDDAFIFNFGQTQGFSVLSLFPAHDHQQSDLQVTLRQ